MTEPTIDSEQPAPPQPHNRGPRPGVMGHLRGRLAGLIGVEALLGIASALGLAAMAVVIADAVLVLPEPMRRAAPWLLGFVAMIGVVVAAMALRRLGDGALARRYERADPSLGTAMTNAVQLARRNPRSPVERVLCEQAVDYARQRSRRLAAWPLMRRGVVAAGGVTLLTLAVWTVGAAGFADVFAAVLPRLTDPAGDHPPYSRVKIDATAEQPSVLYGGQCEVRAVAAGAPVDTLTLVSESGGQRTQTVMFRRPDRSFFQTLTNLRSPTTFYVTDGRARSYRRHIDIRYTPRITLVELTADYPQYTQLRPKKWNLQSTGFAVPRRTVLHLRVASNRPLKSGTLELTPLLGGGSRTITLEPTPSNPTIVAGDASIDQAAAYTIGVTDVAGQDSAEPRKGRITIDKDHRPQIIVLEPGRDAVATPHVSIPVRIAAEDDYAVDHVVWFRGFNRSIDRPLRMAARASGRRVETEGSFNLADLGVRPGDTIDYFFEAVDNDPDPTMTRTGMTWAIAAAVLIGAGVIRAAASATPKAQSGTAKRGDAPAGSGAADNGDLVVVANLIYAGTRSSVCFSEQFLTNVATQTSIQTARKFKPVKLADRELYRYPFAVMTGEGSFTLTETERENLKRYLQRGGFLLASSGCSSGQWDQSFRREMQLMFPDRKLQPLTLKHEVFHTIYNITSLERGHGRSGEATLYGLSFGGKIVAIYSSDGLNDTATMHGCCCCGGSEIINARKINANILAYALLQ